MRIEKERGEIDASKKDKQEDIDRYEYEAREELDRLIEDEQDPTMKTDTDDDGRCYCAIRNRRRARSNAKIYIL
jgi:hypothetical protein